MTAKTRSRGKAAGVSRARHPLSAKRAGKTPSPWMAAKDEADFFLLSPLRGAVIELGKIKLKMRDLSL